MDFLQSADAGLFTFINSTLSHPWLDAFFPAITDLHKTLAFKVGMPVLLLAIFCRSYGKRGVLAFAGLILCLGAADFTASQVLKKNIERSRPFRTESVEALQRCPAGGYSFPSNHATNMFGMATYLTAFFPPASPWFFAIATLVAYSRVYCGVHFPLDVAGGAVWGILFGLLFSFLVRRIASFPRREARA